MCVCVCVCGGGVPMIPLPSVGRDILSILGLAGVFICDPGPQNQS